VVDIVSGGASFAVLALTAGRAMENDFPRPCQPILIDKETNRLSGGAYQLRNYSRLGRNPLQLGTGIAAHGHER
jgi:hypothetical protein